MATHQGELYVLVNQHGMIFKQIVHYAASEGAFNPEIASNGLILCTYLTHVITANWT